MRSQNSTLPRYSEKLYLSIEHFRHKSYGKLRRSESSETMFDSSLSMQFYVWHNMGSRHRQAARETCKDLTKLCCSTYRFGSRKLKYHMEVTGRQCLKWKKKCLVDAGVGTQFTPCLSSTALTIPDWIWTVQLPIQCARWSWLPQQQQPFHAGTVGWDNVLLEGEEVTRDWTNGCWLAATVSRVGNWYLWQQFERIENIVNGIRDGNLASMTEIDVVSCV